MEERLVVAGIKSHLIGRRTWVCGGRMFGRFPDIMPKELHLVAQIKARVARERLLLDTTLDHLDPSSLGHGDADGADTLSGQWWYRRHRKPADAIPAEWGKHGKAAGPIRNQKAIDEWRPELVVAFPGGRGTADMIRRAKSAGIEVLEVLG